jgi:glycosyltransferase involved in cell wall biosynthesis
MLSVCIPVYNARIDALIKALHYQKQKLKYQVEIVVIDDASAGEYRKNNRLLSKYIDKYIELDENVGRSRIRNLFRLHVSGQYLLFIDSDSVIDNSDFLKKDLEILEKHEGEVIVGGSSYSVQEPDKTKILRWKYGREVESQKAERRNINPFASFKTNNVLIPKEILKETPFEEAITGYGHEDTLMGYKLKKAGVGIIHIDNYVINKELDSNEEFLNKSKEAVKSLFKALGITGGDPEFIKDVKLLMWVSGLYKTKLNMIVWVVLNVADPFIEFFLKNGLPSVFLLNLVKLYHALNLSLKPEYSVFFRR